MEFDLLKICCDLVRKGLDHGADEVEVFSVSQKSVEAGIENNDFKLEKTNIGSSVGIRIFKDRSLGFACVNTLDPEKLDIAVRNAISLSKNAPADEHNRLPEAKKLRKIRDMYDKSVAEMSEEAVLQKASKILESAIEVDSRIVVESARFEALAGEKALANSLGIEGSEEFTAIYYDMGAHAVEGSTISAADYRVDGHRFLSDDGSEKISRELATSLVDSLNPIKVESFTGSLIISPLASIELLVSPILFSVDSNNIQKGISKFRDKIGENVTASIISVSDDGTLARGLSSSSFDREGVPHKKFDFLENGKLSGYMYDQYTANKESRESTGHASGSPRGVPSIDATNIKVMEGRKKMDELISSVKKGLFIQRFSGRVDPISGDMSGVAKMSREITDGVIGSIVRETLISGNVYEMLLNIDTVSRDRKRIMDFILPYFKVDDISITSG